MAAWKARRSSKTASCTSPTDGARSTKSTPTAARGCCSGRWIQRPTMTGRVRLLAAGSVTCCGVDNLGVSLWGDLVISHTLDGRLIATNKETGQVTWQRPVANPD